MQADAAEIDGASNAAAPTKPKRRRSQAAKPRLLTVEDLDKRTGIYRQVADEIRAIEVDLGGADRLSTAERVIVSDAALAGAMAADIGVRWLRGEQVQVGEYATLVNVRRRNLESVGLQRRANDVTPSLASYLAAHDAGKVEAEPAHRAARCDHLRQSHQRAFV
jgi:hypothetical protein